ncbi:hypothetical protein AYI68_g470 [Smittium mucronatum]|uniref:Velvet domain-containing protein n=1 Tax=Smittium mucronatum TaxID=133383 RepID=A0A1R0H809_9FUNG|nr:hypothetical protein AYI68_g470 [Smittium mucronatum]
MEDVVSFQFTQVKQNNSHRDQISFELKIRQQPEHSRMCGVGEKADRRPIDPPPIIQLEVFDPTLPGNRRQFLHNPYYFMYTTLVSSNGNEELSILPDRKARTITGSSVSSLSFLRDDTGKDGAFFVFPDLSVRCEGVYKLKFLLFEIVGSTVYFCKSAISSKFTVYSAKKFPGMDESTPLTRLFAEQGLKIRVRKEQKPSKIRGDRNRQLNLVPDSSENFYRKPAYDSESHPMSQIGYAPLSATEARKSRLDYGSPHGSNMDGSYFDYRPPRGSSRSYDINSHGYYLPGPKNYLSEKRSSFRDHQDRASGIDNRLDYNRGDLVTQTMDLERGNLRYIKESEDSRPYVGYKNSERFVESNESNAQDKYDLIRYRGSDQVEQSVDFRNSKNRDFDYHPRRNHEYDSVRMSGRNQENKTVSRDEYQPYSSNRAIQGDEFRQSGPFRNSEYIPDLRNDEFPVGYRISNPPLVLQDKIQDNYRFGRANLDNQNGVVYNSQFEFGVTNRSPKGMIKRHTSGDDRRRHPYEDNYERVGYPREDSRRSPVVIRDGSNRYFYNDKKYVPEPSIPNIYEEYSADLGFYNSRSKASVISNTHSKKRNVNTMVDFRDPDFESNKRISTTEKGAIESGNGKRLGHTIKEHGVSSRSESPKIRRITVNDLLINDNSTNSSPRIGP